MSIDPLSSFSPSSFESIPHSAEEKKTLLFNLLNQSEFKNNEEADFAHNLLIELLKCLDHPAIYQLFSFSFDSTLFLERFFILSAESKNFTKRPRKRERHDKTNRMQLLQTLLSKIQEMGPEFKIERLFCLFAVFLAYKNSQPLTDSLVSTVEDTDFYPSFLKTIKMFKQSLLRSDLCLKFILLNGKTTPSESYKESMLDFSSYFFDHSKDLIDHFENYLWILPGKYLLSEILKDQTILEKMKWLYIKSPKCFTPFFEDLALSTSPISKIDLFKLFCDAGFLVDEINTIPVFSSRTPSDFISIFIRHFSKIGATEPKCPLFSKQFLSQFFREESSKTKNLGVPWTTMDSLISYYGIAPLAYLVTSLKLEEANSIILDYLLRPIDGKLIVDGENLGNVKSKTQHFIIPRLWLTLIHKSIHPSYPKILELIFQAKTTKKGEFLSLLCSVFFKFPNRSVLDFFIQKFKISEEKLFSCFLKNKELLLKALFQHPQAKTEIPQIFEAQLSIIHSPKEYDFSQQEALALCTFIFQGCLSYHQVELTEILKNLLLKLDLDPHEKSEMIFKILGFCTPQLFPDLKIPNLDFAIQIIEPISSGLSHAGFPLDSFFSSIQLQILRQIFNRYVEIRSDFLKIAVHRIIDLKKLIKNCSSIYPKPVITCLDRLIKLTKEEEDCVVILTNEFFSQHFFEVESDLFDKPSFLETEDFKEAFPDLYIRSLTDTLKGIVDELSLSEPLSAKCFIVPSALQNDSIRSPSIDWVKGNKHQFLQDFESDYRTLERYAAKLDSPLIDAVTRAMNQLVLSLPFLDSPLLPSSFEGIADPKQRAAALVNCYLERCSSVDPYSIRKLETIFSSITLLKPDEPPLEDRLFLYETDLVSDHKEPISFSHLKLCFAKMIYSVLTYSPYLGIPIDQPGRITVYDQIEFRLALILNKIETNLKETTNLELTSQALFSLVQGSLYCGTRWQQESENVLQMLSFDPKTSLDAQITSALYQKRIELIGEILVTDIPIYQQIAPIHSVSWIRNRFHKELGVLPITETTLIPELIYGIESFFPDDRFIKRFHRLYQNQALSIVEDVMFQEKNREEVENFILRLIEMADSSFIPFPFFFSYLKSSYPIIEELKALYLGKKEPLDFATSSFSTQSIQQMLEIFHTPDFERRLLSQDLLYPTLINKTLIELKEVLQEDTDFLTALDQDTTTAFYDLKETLQLRLNSAISFPEGCFETLAKSSTIRKTVRQFLKNAIALSEAVEVILDDLVHDYMKSALQSEIEGLKKTHLSVYISKQRAIVDLIEKCTSDRDVRSALKSAFSDKTQIEQALKVVQDLFSRESIALDILNRLKKVGLDTVKIEDGKRICSLLLFEKDPEDQIFSILIRLIDQKNKEILHDFSAFEKISSNPSLRKIFAFFKMNEHHFFQERASICYFCFLIQLLTC